MATSKIKEQKTKKKVPKAKTTVKVVMLKCQNCGEEDEKVHYCAHCDSPMDVVEVVERTEDEIDGDASIKKEKAGDGSEDDIDESDLEINSDENVDELIENGSLTDIFAEGDATPASSDLDSDDADMSLDDMVSTLDDE